MDLEKIKKLQAQAQANKGGRKGFSKPARTGAASNADNDKKLSLALKKLSVQPIQGIEEVNLFHDSGKVLNFAAPKVHAAIPSNTYAVYGHGTEKDMTELVPGILNQLGPDSLASLKKMAESYQGARGGFGGGKDQEPDDDDVPDLVESFDVADDSAQTGETEPAGSSSNKLEELE